MQGRLWNTNRVSTNKNKEVIIFARLVEEGKVNKVIKFWKISNKGWILPLSDETFEILKFKTFEIKLPKH